MRSTIMLLSTPLRFREYWRIIYAFAYRLDVACIGREGPYARHSSDCARATLASGLKSAQLSRMPA